MAWGNGRVWGAERKGQEAGLATSLPGGWSFALTAVLQRRNQAWQRAGKGLDPANQ